MHVERKKVGGRERRKRGAKCDAFLKRRVKRSQENCLSRFPHGGQVGGESSRGLALRRRCGQRSGAWGAHLCILLQLAITIIRGTITDLTFLNIIQVK